VPVIATTHTALERRLEAYKIDKGEGVRRGNGYSQFILVKFLAVAVMLQFMGATPGTAWHPIGLDRGAAYVQESGTSSTHVSGMSLVLVVDASRPHQCCFR
jgi:hypothetical protein